LAKNQTLELDAGTPCPVSADESLLAVLVRNLVDNAVRYSPAGACVNVSVQLEGDQVLLRVEDSGPGLPPEVQQRLGQRFYRLPGQAESGSGLGWSIVRRIAAVLDASVQLAASTALGGLAVSVQMPAAATGASR